MHSGNGEDVGTTILKEPNHDAEADKRAKRMLKLKKLLAQDGAPDVKTVTRSQAKVTQQLATAVHSFSTSNEDLVKTSCFVNELATKIFIKSRTKTT